MKDQPTEESVVVESLPNASFAEEVDEWVQGMNRNYYRAEADRHRKVQERRDAFYREAESTVRFTVPA